MIKIIPILLLLAFSFATVSAFAQMGAAQTPVITKQVPIIQNASPNQCPSSWKGRAGPEQFQNDTAVGQFTGMSAPGVRSCTGCRVVGSACVCATCYDYFD